MHSSFNFYLLNKAVDLEILNNFGIEEFFF